MRLPRIGKSRGYVFALIALVGILAAVGCAQGSYPLDIFYEMHYQPSYKVHEPPRISVPESAVAWFPPPKATSFTDDGQHLYQVNCSMCHGTRAKGDGPVLLKMMNTYGYEPVVTPDLTSQTVRAMDIAGIKTFMRSGVRVMPSFSKLLTPEEIDLVAAYVVNCLQSAQPDVCP